MTTDTATKAEKAPKQTTKDELAVIKTGGKQYIVSVGQVVKIEKIIGKSKGDKVVFDDVLLVTKAGKTEIGDPTLKTKVEGEIIEEAKSGKVTVIKFKAKSNYFKKNGHRQPFIKVRITGIK